MTQVRVLAALACVVGAALLPAAGVVLQFVSTPNLYRPRDDPISAFERRFVAMREELRGQPIVVGYLAPAQLDAKARRAHLYMTRYTLAPTHVRDSVTKRLVIADLNADRSLLPPGYTIRRDFGGGLLLLERVPK